MGNPRERGVNTRSTRAVGRSQYRQRVTCQISGCRAPAAPGAPLHLCDEHLWQAHEWVSRDIGTTDLLPSPCVGCGSRLGVRWPSGWLCAICEWRHGELPDGDRLDARVDVVYYLRAGDRIKIGTSGNPRSRLAALRYDELLAFERGGRALEQQRHSEFAQLRFAGSEWFRAERELLEHVEAVRFGVDEPWHPYLRWVSEKLALQS